MSTEVQVDEAKVDELADNILRGVESTLKELGEELPDQVDGMTAKQLRRALKATINYIYKKDPEIDIESLSPREAKFLGSVFTLVETGVSYSMHIIGELHAEESRKRKEEAEKEGNNG